MPIASGCPAVSQTFTVAHNEGSLAAAAAGMSAAASRAATGTRRVDIKEANAGPSSEL